MASCSLAVHWAACARLKFKFRPSSARAPRHPIFRPRPNIDLSSRQSRIAPRGDAGGRLSFEIPEQCTSHSPPARMLTLWTTVSELLNCRAETPWLRMSLPRRGATNARMRARRANLTPARNEVIARQMPICLRVAESRDAAGHEHLPLTWDPSLGDAPACGFDTEKRPAKMQLARRLNGTFWCTCPGKGKIQHVLVTYSFFVAGRVAALAISRLPLPTGV